MALISRRTRRTRQPQGPIRIDRNNKLGAKVIEFLPLNGRRKAVVSGNELTLGAGGSFKASTKGVGLRGDGLAAVASIPLNLSAYKQISVGFSLYWDAFSDNDAFAMEFGTPLYSSNSAGAGFFVDPNSAVGSEFLAVSGRSGAGTNGGSFPRPSAGVWHRYLMMFDTTTGAVSGVGAYVNGVAQAMTTRYSDSVGAATFVNGTLYLLSRSGTSLFGNGNLQDLTFYSGILSAREALEDYAATYQILPAPERRILVAASVPAGTYTLAAASASFSVTGNATGMKAGRQLAAATASFGITGNATALKRGYALPAVQATFAVTGNAAGLKTARRMAAAPGSFSLTGINATLTYASLAKILQATSASFTLTGNATGMRLGRRLAASPGVFGLTGQAVTLKTARRMPISAGSYALSGQEVGLIKAGQRILSASTAAFALTGISASLKANRRLLAATGQIVLNGYAAGLRRRYNLAAGTASYAVLGQDAQFGRAYRLPVVCAQFALTGNAVTMLYAPLVTFKMPAARNIYIGKARLTTLPGRDRTLVLD